MSVFQSVLKLLQVRGTISEDCGRLEWLEQQAWDLINIFQRPPPRPLVLEACIKTKSLAALAREALYIGFKQ